MQKVQAGNRHLLSFGRDANRENSVSFREECAGQTGEGQLVVTSVCKGKGKSAGEIVLKLMGPGLETARRFSLTSFIRAVGRKPMCSE